MNKPIATMARTNEILAKYDLYAKKNFGQNFIIEPGIVEKIARLSHADEYSAVIEIGPGIGALTEQLARVAGHVLAFEIDDRLIEVLADTLSECRGRSSGLSGSGLERDGGEAENTVESGSGLRESAVLYYDSDLI